MIKKAIIEQPHPGAELYRAHYEFEDNGEFISCMIEPLTKKEETFYKKPGPNKYLVNHLHSSGLNSYRKRLEQKISFGKTFQATTARDRYHAEQSLKFTHPSEDLP